MKHYCKSIFLFILFSIQIFTVKSQTNNFINGFEISNVKIGDHFKNSTSEYKVAGVSSKTGEYYYQYLKSIDKKALGHSVDRIIEIVKDGIVTGFMYLLIPNNGDVGVPKQMAESFKINLAMSWVSKMVYMEPQLMI